MKFLSLRVLQICQGVRQKLWGSRDLGHAPFLDWSLQVFEIWPLCIYVPNFSSLPPLVLQIRQGVRQNFGGHVTQATQLFWIFLCGFLRYCPVHLRAKFQISSSTRFGDMLARANYEIHCSAHIKGQKLYCACAVACDLGQGVRNGHIFGILDAICLFIIQLLGGSGDD